MNAGGVVESRWPDEHVARIQPRARPDPGRGDKAGGFGHHNTLVQPHARLELVNVVHEQAGVLPAGHEHVEPRGSVRDGVEDPALARGRGDALWSGCVLDGLPGAGKAFGRGPELGHVAVRGEPDARR